MNEEWKPVVGFESLYEVSNLGRVRSLDRRREITGECKTACFYPSRIKKQFLNKAGYYQILLCKDGKQHMKIVSRLVAEAFLPNPNNYPEVNHMNEVTSDNRVTNLEWCSIDYNRNYGTRGKRIAIKLSKPCYAIYPDGSTQEFPSIHEAGRSTGICYKNIHSVCAGKRERAGGLRWQYSRSDHDEMEVHNAEPQN